jgi:hypothetical protein
MKEVETGSGDPSPWESGPPLLFVHGMWHGDWCWEPFVARFRNAGFNARAFNLSFHGGPHAGTRRRLWRATLRTYLDDLRREARKFPTPPILVGHSLGCHLIEVLMAEIRPPAVILLAPTRPAIFTRSVGRFLKEHFFEFCWLVLLLTMWPPIRNLQMARELLFGPDFPESELEEIHTKRLQNESYWVAVQLLMGGLLPFLRIGGRAAAPFGTPVYVVGGELDLAVLPRDVVEVATYHSARRRVFPKTAHDLMLGRGSEAVADAMLEWLRSQGLGGHAEAKPAGAQISLQTDANVAAEG